LGFGLDTRLAFGLEPAFHVDSKQKKKEAEFFMGSWPVRHCPARNQITRPHGSNSPPPPITLHLIDAFAYSMA
jgi:hypothetical protein